MPYVVRLKPEKGVEPSLDQLLAGEVPSSSSHKARAYPGTVTRVVPSVPQALYSARDVDRLVRKLSELSFLHYPIDETYLKKLYRVYSIKKRSGGLRTICQPLPPLYAMQVELRTLFEREFGLLYHTAAFAYCPGRSIVDCVRRHQANQSNWFLKLDFKDFFGSTSPDFVLRQLSMVAPYSAVADQPQGRELLSRALRVCFLGGGLPQGTPISPMLTNLVMIPIDHALANELHRRGFVYTRYADDMQISHREKFDPVAVVAIVRDVLASFSAPYVLNESKTRFGSCAGRNWNLGLMFNKDHRITIGHQEHKRMKARLHAFVLDHRHGKPWSSREIARLVGQLAYFQSVEPAASGVLIARVGEKLNVNVRRELRWAYHDAVLKENFNTMMK